MEKQAPYSNMWISDIEFMMDGVILGRDGKGKLNVYEIGCHRKSALIFKKALRRGEINSYTGISDKEEEVLRLRRMGLLGFLVKDEEGIIKGLDALQETGNGVVVMLGFPETNPERARRYQEMAEERNLDVLTYPFI